jgi:hypothetical protein
MEVVEEKDKARARLLQRSLQFVQAREDMETLWSQVGLTSV